MVSYDRTIPPGGKGKITLKVSTRNRRGKLTKRALVITSDPDNKAVKISISGKVKSLISVEPRSYVFLSGLPDEEITRELRIVGVEVPKFYIKKITDNLDGKVTYKLITVKEGREYLLRIKNNFKKQGSYYGEINLETDSPKKPNIKIRVSGRIKSELAVIPRVVYFGRITQKEKVIEKNITKRIIVKDLKKQPFKIVGLDYNKKLFNIVVEEQEKQDTKILRITPIVNNLKKGINYDLLRIKTDLKNYPEVSVGMRVYLQ